MAKLDWARFFRQHGVQYVEEGPNVKRGNLNIRCPFCGPNDPSHHMGVDPKDGAWACWRQSEHRGRSPVRLVARILNITYHAARVMLGIGPEEDPSEFEEIARSLKDGWSPKDVAEADKELKLPGELREVYASGLSKRFADYIVSRHFRAADLRDFCELYGIRCAWVGEWKDRIFIPIFLQGTLVSWTSRAIGDALIRYKDLDKERSIIPPKQTLYNYDFASEGGHTLLVVEGPIDVLKLDYYARGFGVRAVGLFTKTIGDSQRFLLLELAPKFQQVVFMLDTERMLDSVDAMKMVATMPQVRGSVWRWCPVPYGYKDGGAMPSGRVKLFAADLVAGRIRFESVQSSDGTEVQGVQDSRGHDESAHEQRSSNLRYRRA